MKRFNELVYSPRLRWLFIGGVFGLVGSSFNVVLTRVISYVSPHHLLSSVSIVLSMGTILMGVGALFGKRAIRRFRLIVILTAVMLPTPVFVLIWKASFFFPMVQTQVFFENPMFLPLMAAATGIIAPAFVFLGMVFGACFTGIVKADRRLVPYLIAISAVTFFVGYSASTYLVQGVGLLGVVIAISLLALIPAFSSGTYWIALIIAAGLTLQLDKNDRLFTHLMMKPKLWITGHSKLVYRGGGWSPYARVDFYQTSDHTLAGVYNGVQQWMVTNDNRLNIDIRRQGYSFFTGDVVVIGAGGGNGVQSLRNAATVTAVELDPMVVDTMRGRLRYFNQNAYQLEKVQVIIGDGRAFLERTRRKYDAIIYEGADGNISNNKGTLISMENYLYTREGLGAALSALRPHGNLYIIFSVQMPVINRVISSLPNDIKYRLYSGLVKQPIRFPYRLLIASRHAEGLAALPEYFQKLGLEIREQHVPDGSINQERIVDDNRPALYISSPRQLAFLGYVLACVLAALSGLVVFSRSRYLGSFFSVIGATFIMTELLLVNTMKALLGGFLETAAVVIGSMTVAYAVGNIVATRIRFSIVVLSTIAGFSILIAGCWLGIPNGSLLIHLLWILLLVCPVGFAIGLYFPKGMALTREEEASWNAGIDTIGAALGSIGFYVVMISLGLQSVALVTLFGYILAALVLRQAQRG